MSSVRAQAHRPWRNRRASPFLSVLVLAWGCASSERLSQAVDPAHDGAAPWQSHDAATDGSPGPRSPDAAQGHDAGHVAVDAGSPPEPLCATRSDRHSPWRALHGGELLGARVLSADRVEFSLFAPNATAVHVMGTFNGFSADEHPLLRAADGVWSTILTIHEPAGQEYRFVVDGRSVADPYARANLGIRGNSIIVAEQPFAWSDQAFARKPREQLVIYETHVGDFTRDASSAVAEPLRGKFSGFVHKLAHLKRLGVNAVELMPIAENQSDGYDWGYSATLPFAPDANYASAAGGAQVEELKQLVDALHGAGIAVIVDVVYNHVWGQTGVNHFWGVDPVYYFDVDGDGDPENDRSDWGYMVATHRPAVRKLMHDNMKFLMDEYHVDGFRIDATSHMDIEAVLDVVRSLDDDGYCDRYYIAEEFDGEHNARIRAFNQELGRTVVSSWGTGYKNRVWDALRWPDTSMTDLTNVTYFSANDGWQRSEEVVNYISSHDEGTVNSWLGASKDQVKVAATHLLTAAGIPMLWFGDEFLRVHFANHGTDATREDKNRVDWTLAQAHGDLVDYYGALVKLRIAHPSLYRSLSGPVGERFVWDNASAQRAIGYVRTALGDHAFVVLANYQPHAQEYDVSFPAPGTWHLMADGRSATSELPGLSTLEVTGENTRVLVPSTAAHVYMSSEPR
jgi:1,4-alpha-glucan branching enzyme